MSVTKIILQQKSGAVIMTNGYVHENFPMSKYRYVSRSKYEIYNRPTNIIIASRLTYT